MMVSRFVEGSSSESASRSQDDYERVRVNINSCSNQGLTYLQDDFQDAGVSRKL